MEQKFVKGSVEFEMFQDYWKMVQKYYVPERSDNWNDEAKSAIDSFKKKYNSVLAENLSLALAEHILAKEKEFGYV